MSELATHARAPFPPPVQRLLAPCGSGWCLRCAPADTGIPERYAPPVELVLAWAADPAARRAPGAGLAVRWSMRGDRPGELASFVIDVEDGLPVRVLPLCSAADPAPDLAIEAPLSVTVAVLAGLVPHWALYRDAAVIGELDHVMCFAGVFESDGYLTAVQPFHAHAATFVADRLATEQALGIAPSAAFGAELGG